MTPAVFANKAAQNELSHTRIAAKFRKGHNQ